MPPSTFDAMKSQYKLPFLTHPVQLLNISFEHGLRTRIMKFQNQTIAILLKSTLTVQSMKTESINGTIY